MIRLILLILVLFLPMISKAAVSISEVAWMGSIDSANHEWIELYNSGESVDVTGWEINDGNNFKIELGGVLLANSYAVLERTSDDSVSGKAFQIYTGAMVNSGATLKLLGTNGSIVDQVSGGEDWQNIGGDNVTKETAQYTNDGWVTAIATPGSGVGEINSVQVNDESSNESEVIIENVQSNKAVKKKSSGGGKAVILKVPDVTLELDIESQTIGYVNQLINFKVSPSGIGENLINSLKYQWNFGDGEIADGKDTKHIFKYPGTYVVTVYGSFKRQEQVSRHEITILPVTMSLTTTSEGDVQVHNDSKYEVDLSGYRIKGEKVFTFPDHSIILPLGMITIPRHKFGDTDDRMLALYDNEAAVLDSIIPKQIQKTLALKEDSESSISKISATSISPSRTVSASEGFSFIDKTESEKTAVPAKVVDNSNQLASVISANQDNKNWPYLGLVGVITLGIIGVYVAPRRNEKSNENF